MKTVSDHPFLVGVAAGAAALAAYCRYRHVVDKTGRVVCRPIDGPASPPMFHISGDLMTRMIYKEIYIDRCYFKHGITLDGVADPFILDIGGNTGLFSRWCAEQYPTARVHVAEPIPMLQECIASNTAAHRDRVVLHRCGISNERGSASFAFFPTTSAGSSMYEGELLAPLNKYPLLDRVGALIGDLQHVDPDYAWYYKIVSRLVRTPVLGHAVLFGYVLPIALAKKASEKLAGLKRTQVNCELLTLEQMLFEDEGCEKGGIDSIKSIDLLKVDVESAEWVVLDGISDALWPKIQQVVVEVTDVVDASTGVGRVQRIVDLFKAKGFTNVVVDVEDWETHVMLDIKTIFATRK